MRPERLGIEMLAGVARIVWTGFDESIRSGRELTNTCTGPASGEARKSILYVPGSMSSQVGLSICAGPTDRRAGTHAVAIPTKTKPIRCLGRFIDPFCRHITSFQQALQYAPWGCKYWLYPTSTTENKHWNGGYLAKVGVQRRPKE